MLLDVMEKSRMIEHFFEPADIYIFKTGYDRSRLVVPDYYLRAAKQNNTVVVRLLIEHKVPINYDSEDFFNNALFWAAVRGNADVINLLLEYGYRKIDVQEEDIKLFNANPDLIKLINK